MVGGLTALPPSSSATSLHGKASRWFAGLETPISMAAVVRPAISPLTLLIYQSNLRMVRATRISADAAPKRRHAARPTSVSAPQIPRSAET